MDYYRSSGSGRGRSSYRGSSYRGSPRGSSSSRGSYRGSRGRGSSGSSSYYEDSSKYSSSSASRFDDYTRRGEISYSSRDDVISRKRVRSDDYSPSQGSYSRRPTKEDDYRSGSRYGSSSLYAEREFKKPRPSEYRSHEEDYRVKEPLRPRPTRGRISSRGAPRRGGIRETIRRGTSYRSGTATTSEILAIRRAKLLQKRITEENAEITSAAAEKEKEKGTEKNAVEVEETSTHTEVKAKKEPEEGGDQPKSATSKEDVERTNIFGRPYVKLQCPACGIKAVTFNEYTKHLSGPVHTRAMKIKSDELKTMLASMRIEQREKQKVADEEDITSMNTRSHFCPICKLTFSQEISTHQSSDLHKKMKNFLMPYCKVCRISFPSPMVYETHICTSDHIRRQHQQDSREKHGTALNDKYMVLDSVSGGEDGDEKEEEVEEKVDTKEEVKEEDLLLGLEFIRTLHVRYCEVCRRYLPRVGAKEMEATVKRHCMTKEHLRCYLHYGNQALLDKIHEEEARDNNPEDKNDDKKEGDAEEPLDDDKLWNDVGELLNETQPGSKSDDEDEEEGGRFDRFKSIEKKENGDIAADSQKKADIVAESVIVIEEKAE